MKIGDRITVKVTEIDEKGRVNVSRKATLPAADLSRNAPRPPRNPDRKPPAKNPPVRNERNTFSSSRRDDRNGNRPPRRKV